MPAPGDAASAVDLGEGGTDDVVVTQALRSLRNSALRCRRARLLLDERRAACSAAMGSAEITAGAAR
jgi:hypothetical protein